MTGLKLDVVTQIFEEIPAEHIIRRITKKTIFHDNGCWEWTGYKKNGYGSISIHDRDRYIHHLSYILFRGKPDGLFVLHECDNRPCWRPNHLYVGTQDKNLADMRSRGRHSKPPTLTGLHNPNAHLTDEQIAELRLMTDRKQRDLARLFGVSQSTVWRLRHGLTRRGAGTR
jgi:HNH endonuclease